MMLSSMMCPPPIRSCPQMRACYSQEFTSYQSPPRPPSFGALAYAIAQASFGNLTSTTTIFGLDKGVHRTVTPTTSGSVVVSHQRVVASLLPGSRTRATIIASTTAGTTLADFATRSLGIGYPGGSLLLLGCVLASLLSWYRTLGSVAVDTVVGPRAETFYWITITLSQTLGTALGDWIADGSLGYSGAALVFGGSLIVIAVLYLRTQVSRVILFWAAFILTRPLGATVGDFLDKPVTKGGLAFSRPVATIVLGVTIALLILVLPQRAGRHPGKR